MSERELIEGLSYAVVTAFEASHGSDLVAQANTLARKAGLDGRYVQFVLERDSENWPPLPGRQAEALMALRGLSAATHAFDYEGYQMPEWEQEDVVNDILGKLAKWSWDQKRQLLNTYFKAMRPTLPEAKRYLEETTGKTWTDRDAMVWLHAALKEAAKRNPAGISSPVMLYRILELIF